MFKFYVLFEYKSIQKKVENIILKEKGSKFIGFSYPIDNEKDIKEILNHLYEIHPKATHHCYAYRLGISGQTYRANDDGEPSGSAGLPIFNQILALELTQILVVVIRYFGGTKLGVAGLVKTYKESAKITLEECQIITKELEGHLLLEFNYAQQNIIFTILNRFNAKILDFQSSELLKIKAKIKLSEKEKIQTLLKELYQIKFSFTD